VRHFDLVIIGTGSANSIPGPEFDDWSIAVVEADKFGGTCLNVGCIPTKMYVHPADVLTALRDVADLGVHATVQDADWTAIRDRVFGRIDAIEASGRAYRKGDETPNITVFEGFGAFTGHKQLEIQLNDGGVETITGDRFVIGAGSRAVVPEYPGLDAMPFDVVHTSDTIMRIEQLPESLVVVGGGYIAAEFAHVFDAYGTTITQVVRGPRLLGHHDIDVSTAFTELVGKRYDLRLQTEVTSVEPGPDGGVLVHLDGPDGPGQVQADLLLIATGRVSNADRLNLDATGVPVAHGRVVVDEHQRTPVDGIFALGDVSSPYALKHVANHEARVVKHNLAHPDELMVTNHKAVPAGVFTHPQIASVGCTEDEARTSCEDPAIAVQRYGDTANGWAREDTTGFVKLIGDKTTGLIIGAHIMGPEAATVIQPIIQAMAFDLPAHQMARGQYWIHPALPEVVENALLQLPVPPVRTQPERVGAAGWADMD
jgi:mycothione reductase